MPPAAESVIHDLGYQRYAGPRLGRGYAVRSLYTHSLRSAFGLGRGAKAKIFPWSIAALVLLVAAAVTVVASVAEERLLTYPGFSDAVNTLTVLFTAVIASEVLCRDLSAGALALYFARPLGRADYALAKLGSVISAIVLLLWVPLLLMFAGNAFATKRGFDGVLDEAGGLAKGLVFALLHAVVIGSIGVLAACLCRRKAFAAVAVVAAFLVTMPVTGVLASANSQALRELSGVTNPMILLHGLGDWLFGNGDMIGEFGPVYAGAGVALVALAVGATITRYRRVHA